MSNITLSQLSTHNPQLKDYDKEPLKNGMAEYDQRRVFIAD